MPTRTIIRNAVMDINSKALQISPIDKTNIPTREIRRPILVFFIFTPRQILIYRIHYIINMCIFQLLLLVFIKSLKKKKDCRETVLFLLEWNINLWTQYIKQITELLLLCCYNNYDISVSKSGKYFYISSRGVSLSKLSIVALQPSQILSLSLSVWSNTPVDAPQLQFVP